MFNLKSGRIFIMIDDAVCQRDKDKRQKSTDYQPENQRYRHGLEKLAVTEHQRQQSGHRCHRG